MSGAGDMTDDSFSISQRMTAFASKLIEVCEGGIEVCEGGGR